MTIQDPVALEEELDAAFLAEQPLARLARENAALKAKIALLENRIVAAWNAFGPIGALPREHDAFDRDDLADLPMWAGGDLDEQIRTIEASLTASEAACLEAERQRDEALAREAKLWERETEAYRIIGKLEQYAINDIMYDGRPIAAWCASYTSRLTIPIENLAQGKRDD